MGRAKKEGEDLGLGRCSEGEKLPFCLCVTGFMLKFFVTMFIVREKGSRMFREAFLWSLLFLVCTHASPWSPGEYPNPFSSAKECGREGVKSSWVCDPDGVVSLESANILEGIILQIARGEAPYGTVESTINCVSETSPGYQVGQMIKLRNILST